MVITNNFENNLIYLFASWPCQWSIKFKGYAMDNTMISIEYKGSNDINTNGTLVSLDIQPQNRKNDIIFINCVSQ